MFLGLHPPSSLAQLSGLHIYKLGATYSVLQACACSSPRAPWNHHVSNRTPLPPHPNKPLHFLSLNMTVIHPPSKSPSCEPFCLTSHLQSPGSHDSILHLAKHLSPGLALAQALIWGHWNCLFAGPFAKVINPWSICHRVDFLKLTYDYTIS